MNNRSDDTIDPGDGLCEIRWVDTEKVSRARAALPASEDLRKGSEYFRLLGEPTRLKMLYALAAEELCVCDLSALLDASPSAVSHQLRLLRAARLVRYRKAGKMVYYTLDHSPLRALLINAGDLNGGQRSGED